MLHPGLRSLPRDSSPPRRGLLGESPQLALSPLWRSPGSPSSPGLSPASSPSGLGRPSLLRTLSRLSRSRAEGPGHRLSPVSHRALGERWTVRKLSPPGLVGRGASSWSAPLRPDTAPAGSCTSLLKFSRADTGVDDGAVVGLVSERNRPCSAPSRLLLRKASPHGGASPVRAHLPSGRLRLARRPLSRCGPKAEAYSEESPRSVRSGASRSLSSRDSAGNDEKGAARGTWCETALGKYRAGSSSARAL